jgi:hypothetical protein
MHSFSTATCQFNGNRPTHYNVHAFFCKYSASSLSTVNGSLVNELLPRDTDNKADLEVFYLHLFKSKTALDEH